MNGLNGKKIPEGVNTKKPSIKQQKVKMIHIQPNNKYPVPENFAIEKAPTPLGELEVAENTASLMKEHSQTIDITQEDKQEAEKLFKNFQTDVTPKSLTQPAVVLALSGYVKQYSNSLVSDAAETRNLIHNRLLEISQCGDPKHELKALELLGKMSDVGAFTEKSEITVSHKSADALQGLIKEKISRLIELDVQDVSEIKDSLDEELDAINDGGNANESGTSQSTKEITESA